MEKRLGSLHSRHCPYLNTDEVDYLVKYQTVANQNSVSSHEHHRIYFPCSIDCSTTQHLSFSVDSLYFDRGQFRVPDNVPHLTHLWILCDGSHFGVLEISWKHTGARTWNIELFFYDPLFHRVTKVFCQVAEGVGWDSQQMQWNGQSCSVVKLISELWSSASHSSQMAGRYTMDNKWMWNICCRGSWAAHVIDAENRHSIAQDEAARVLRQNGDIGVCIFQRVSEAWKPVTEYTFQFSK